MRPDRTKLSDGFLRYWLNTISYAKYINGSTRDKLTQEQLGSIEIDLLPLPIQQRIARFLDEKTARIDELIKKKQVLLDKLAEKRQALITRAVTKGLNPDAPMKPSGIDWLGDIPKHWDIVPLRWYVRTMSGEGLRNEEISIEQTEKDYAPVIGGNGLIGFTTEANSIPNSIAVGRVGAHCGNLHLVSEPSWITDNALMLYNIRMFNRYYLLYTLRVRELNVLASRNAQPLMTGEIVKSQTIPMPPENEQSVIARYINSALLQLDYQSEKINLSVRFLVEYRSALITAAVTGQI